MEKHWFPYGPELQLQCNGKGGQLELTGTCGFRVNTVMAMAILTVIWAFKFLADVNTFRHNISDLI